MIKLTENARKELEAFFADKPKSGIRVYLAPGGCSGPHLGLALDEANDDDHVVEEGGFTFCASKGLWEQIGGVSIDLSYMGFTLDPVNPLPGGSGSCGGGCCGSCGSCGSH